MFKNSPIYKEKGGVLSLQFSLNVTSCALLKSSIVWQSTVERHSIYLKIDTKHPTHIYFPFYSITFHLDPTTLLSIKIQCQIICPCFCLKISSRNNGNDMIPPVIFFVPASSESSGADISREKNSNSPFFHTIRKGDSAGPWFYSSIPVHHDLQECNMRWPTANHPSRCP